MHSKGKYTGVCVYVGGVGQGRETERKMGEKTRYLDRFKLYEKYIQKN